MHGYMDACMHACIYVCMHVCMYKLCMYIHAVCACMHMHTHIGTHMHAHTQTQICLYISYMYVRMYMILYIVVILSGCLITSFSLYRLVIGLTYGLVIVDTVECKCLLVEVNELDFIS